MKLYSDLSYGMLQALATKIGTSGSITFFTATGFPTTELMATTQRILLSSTPISAYSGTQTTSTLTKATAVFGPMTTGTINATDTAAIFAILSATQAAVDTGANVILTGSVGTTGSDINFNVVAWDTGDNVSITSLTFTQPKE